MAVERQQAYKQKNAVKLLKIISQDFNQQTQNWAGIEYSKFRKQLNSHQELPKPQNIINHNAQRQKKMQTIFRKRSDKKSSLPYEICPNYCKQYKSFTFTNEENSSQNYQTQRRRENRQRKMLKATTCTKLHAQQSISKISVGQEVSSQLRTTGSEQYILKITKFSIRNKKQMHQSLNQNQNVQENVEKLESLTGRLSQKYKNKIKKKISHKFLLRKFPNDRNSSVSKLNGQEGLNKKLSEKIEQEKTPKINLLQSWLESNRYRRRKSVACLLKQLFQHKSYQKQQKIEKKLPVQSTRLLSLASDQKLTHL